MLSQRFTGPSSRTIFLSRLIGLFCILTALSLLVHARLAIETTSTIVHDRPLLLILGLIALGSGLAMVLAHNVWSGGALPVVVTLVGWVILIRGLILLFLSPQAVVGLYEAIHFEEFFYLYVAISLVLGLYLTYAGFTSPLSPSDPATKR